jgi:hypothetical protein
MTTGDTFHVVSHHGDSPMDVSTVVLLNQLAVRFSSDVNVIEFSRSIIDPYRSNDLPQLFRDVSSWFVDHFLYVPDPIDDEYIQSPLALIRDVMSSGHFRGDCDDVTLFMCSVLRSIGIHCVILGVSAKSDHLDHVILGVTIGKRSFQYDPCTFPGYVNYDRFFSPLT